MKIAWSLRSFHAIFTPIRYAARAAQVKRMLYPPYGVGERWPIERGEAKPIIRLAAEKKKPHIKISSLKLVLLQKQLISNNDYSKFREV